MTDKAKKLGKEVVTGVYYDIPEGLNCGLSKREYFAVLAMQALITRTDPDRNFDLSKSAIKFSETLLEELSKNE